MAMLNPADTPVTNPVDTSFFLKLFHPDNPAQVRYETIASVVAAAVGGAVIAQDFNAKGNGTTDDTAALQAALNTGSDVWLKPGTYRVTGTLNYAAAGQRIIGTGISDCSIVFANGTQDGLTCNGFNTCSIEGVKLTGSGKTGGALLVVTGGAYLFAARRIYWSDAFNGLDFNKVNSALVEASACGGNMTGAWAIRFTGDSGFKSDVLTLRSVGLANSGGPSTFAGILWDSYAHTMELDDVRIVRCGYGILTQRSTGSDSLATPSFLNASKLEIDFPTKEALLLNYMNDAWITNLYASGGGTSTEHGLNIASACTSIRITSGRISGMSKHGILAAGTNILITGLRIYSCSGAGSGTYSGIYLDTTATDVAVTGCDLGKSSGETQKYGLEIAAGASRYTYSGNLVNGNVTGQILTQTDLTYLTGGTFRHVFSNAGGAHMHIGGSANPVANYLRVAGGAAGSAVTVLGEGSDTNIDIAFTPKGTGTMRFGTYTSNADVACNGWVTIKDSGGTTRKLMTTA